jgi:cobalt-zinc-cadmium efflux system membrane fusion protein
VPTIDRSTSGCYGQKGKGEPERPSLVVTVYESGLELFMEYPALVVGQDSPLVAHFTDARDPAGFKVCHPRY